MTTSYASSDSEVVISLVISGAVPFRKRGERIIRILGADRFVDDDTVPRDAVAEGVSGSDSKRLHHLLGEHGLALHGHTGRGGITRLPFHEREDGLPT